MDAVERSPDPPTYYSVALNPGRVPAPPVAGLSTLVPTDGHAEAPFGQLTRLRRSSGWPDQRTTRTREDLLLCCVTLTSPTAPTGPRCSAPAAHRLGANIPLARLAAHLASAPS